MILRCKAFGVIGVMLLSLLFMGAEGCNQALEEIRADEEAGVVQSTEGSAVEGDEVSDEASADDVDEAIDVDLQYLIREGYAKLKRNEEGDFILIDQDGNTLRDGSGEIIILKGKKAPVELKEGAELGGGPEVTSPAMD
jgi:hypothetical protein